MSALYIINLQLPLISLITPYTQLNYTFNLLVWANVFTWYQMAVYNPSLVALIVLFNLNAREEISLNRIERGRISWVITIFWYLEEWIFILYLD